MNGPWESEPGPYPLVYLTVICHEYAIAPPATLAGGRTTRPTRPP
jgi:hypothetical protein